jgi:hypothetical protein
MRFSLFPCALFAFVFVCQVTTVLATCPLICDSRWRESAKCVPSSTPVATNRHEFLVLVQFEYSNSTWSLGLQKNTGDFQLTAPDAKGYIFRISDGKTSLWYKLPSKECRDKLPAGYNNHGTKFVWLMFS